MCEKPSVTQNANAEEISSVKTKKSSGKSGSKRAASVTAEIGQEIWGEREAAEETKPLNKRNSNGNIECEVVSADDYRTEDGGGAKMRKKKKKTRVAFAGHGPNVDISFNPAAPLGNEECSKSSFQRRLWTMLDEIRLLKGVCEFRTKTGSDASLDSDAFFDFIKDCFLVQPSKKELMYELGWMKNNFLEKSKRGTNLSFSYAHASTVFELSKEIWGKREAAEETQPLNKSNSNGNVESEVVTADNYRTEDGGGARMRKKKKKTLLAFARHDPNVDITFNPAAPLGNEGSSKGWFQRRLWTMFDEIRLLKGAYEFRMKTGSNASLDSDVFFDFIKDCFLVQPSKKELMYELGWMKNNFLEKSKRGTNLSFSYAHASTVFELSKEIWGKREAAEETQPLNKSNSKGNVECEVVTADDYRTEDGGGARMRKKKKKTRVAFACHDPNVDITFNPAAPFGNEECSKSSFQRRLWTMFDETRLLKGVCEFRTKTGSDASLDSDAFFDFIKDCFLVQPSKKELMYELGWMKNNFLEKSKRGTNLSFSNAHASTVFELSKQIWGKREAAEETQPLNKSNSNGNVECEVVTADDYRTEDGDGARMRKKKKKKTRVAFAGHDPNVDVTFIPAAPLGNKESSKGSFQRQLWTMFDEIRLLKGVCEFRTKTGSDVSLDSDVFFDFIKDCFLVQSSKKELMYELGWMKNNFLEKSKRGTNLSFSYAHASTVFELSKEIWGKREAAEETQPLNKSNSNGNLECEVFTADDYRTEDGGGARMRKKKNALVDFAGHDPNVDITFNPAVPLGNEGTSKGSFQRWLWTMFDEIRLLMGVCEFRTRTGSDASLDSDAFFDFIKDCFLVQPSKIELMHELGWMKNNFLQKSKRGTNLSFSYAHSSSFFELSKKIWGNGEVDEEMQTLSNSNAKGNLEYDGAAVKYVSKSELGGNWTEEIIEEENEKKDMERIDGDAFCAQYPYLLAAVETIVSQRMFGEFPKRVLLEELWGFCGDKVREWDNKWKALLIEEMKLQTRKLKLLAELSDAAF